MNREVDPPFRPNVVNILYRSLFDVPKPKGKLDTSNFDEEFTKEAISDSPSGVNLTHSQQLMFEGFR